MMAVGSARPDSKARRVTADMVRALLDCPSISDDQAKRILDHLYSFADVAVDAFIEQQLRSEVFVEADGASVAAISHHPLTSPAAA